MDDGPEGNDPLAARILLKGDLPVAHPAGLLAFLSRRLNRQRQPLSAGYAGALVAGNHLRVAAFAGRDQNRLHPLPIEHGAVHPGAV